jgi:hypothetical protein
MILFWTFIVLGCGARKLTPNMLVADDSFPPVRVMNDPSFIGTRGRCIALMDTSCLPWHSLFRQLTSSLGLAAYSRTSGPSSSSSRTSTMVSCSTFSFWACKGLARWPDHHRCPIISSNSVTLRPKHGILSDAFTRAMWTSYIFSSASPQMRRVTLSQCQSGSN